MRKPKFYSPTSISLFYTNREEYYLKYLADSRPPRLPQTKPMSVGSAFDAYVKSYLHKQVFDTLDPKFTFDALFEAQVEEQNREFAREAGRICFQYYKKYGLADLMSELETATEDPVFEFKVEGNIRHKSKTPIPLHGYPDLYFKSSAGFVVYDWKVNGYCSKSNTSPAKGYISVKGPERIRGINKSHKDAVPMMHNGIMINAGTTMEYVNEKWADQLSVYAWLLGEPVGSPFIVGIDQLACGPTDEGEPSFIRIAKHRCKVSDNYQEDLMSRIVKMIEIIESGIILELPKDQALERQNLLDQYYLAYEGDDPKDKWFQNMSRQHSNF